MAHTHDLLVTLTVWCLQLVGIVWLVAALWFAARRDDRPLGRFRYFFRNLLPEPWLLVAAPAISVVIRLVPRTDWRDLQFWNPVLALIGTGVVVASCALMVWARWVIGAMWAGRPLVQQRHELRTSGPYALVRHPIYTGFAGLAIGSMLVFGFGATLAVSACAMVFLYLRVRSEERMLLSTFGARYQKYRESVPALVPLLSTGDSVQTHKHR